MYAPLFIGPGKVPDNRDYAEKEEGAAVNGIYIVKGFEPGNFKVSAPCPPGNKVEITGHIPGIDQYQDAYVNGNDAEEEFPGHPADRPAGIVEAEQGEECPYAGTGAALYLIGGKGRFQGWGSFLQKTAEGVQGYRQGSAAKVLHAGLAPIVKDKEQDDDTDYQVNAGYNLQREYAHPFHSIYPSRPVPDPRFTPNGCLIPRKYYKFGVNLVNPDFMGFKGIWQGAALMSKIM
jgi:hypothetical protein